jgi:hypothetical protein
MCEKNIVQGFLPTKNHEQHWISFSKKVFRKWNCNVDGRTAYAIYKFTLLQTSENIRNTLVCYSVKFKVLTAVNMNISFLVCDTP